MCIRDSNSASNGNYYNNKRTATVTITEHNLDTSRIALSMTAQDAGKSVAAPAFGKTALIDFAGNTAACGVGALGETFDWPVPITMMLSLAAGITVSKMCIRDSCIRIQRELFIQERREVRYESDRERGQSRYSIIWNI